MGLLWPAGVTFVARRAPDEKAATAQALLSAVMYGFAPLLATQIAGAVYDAAGARMVLAFAGSVMAVGVLIFGAVRNQIGVAASASPEGISGES